MLSDESDDFWVELTSEPECVDRRGHSKPASDTIDIFIAYSEGKKHAGGAKEEEKRINGVVHLEGQCP